MGSGVSVELSKPLDASDVQCTGSVVVARNEVIRLRNALGHLAKQAGFSDVVYDASDLCLFEDEAEDFQRCINEIVHIRHALHLNTQGSRRKARGPYTQTTLEFEVDEDSSEDSSDDDVRK